MFQITLKTLIKVMHACLAKVNVNPVMNLEIVRNVKMDILKMVKVPVDNVKNPYLQTVENKN